jgi:hypothetical protein
LFLDIAKKSEFESSTNSEAPLPPIMGGKENLPELGAGDLNEDFHLLLRKIW